MTGFWSNVDHTTPIHSGATTLQIRELGVAPQGPSDGPFAMLGDLDGDARSEIAYTSRAGGAWVVHIASGATGAVLRTCTPAPALAFPAVFELDLVALGDITGDGVEDLALGGAHANRVYVYSGANGALVRTHSTSETGAKFGFALASRADCDGVPDLIVGAPLWKVGSATQIGRAWRISPCPLPARAVGAPKLNSLGSSPVLSWNGNSSASGASPFTIVASNVLNQKTWTFFYGVGDPVALTFQGGTLSAPGPRRRTPYQSSGGSSSGSDCSGAFAIDFNARISRGVDPSLVSAARAVGQFWSRDPGDPFTTNLTSAVDFVICP